MTISPRVSKICLHQWLDSGIVGEGLKCAIVDVLNDHVLVKNMKKFAQHPLDKPFFPVSITSTIYKLLELSNYRICKYMNDA